MFRGSPEHHKVQVTIETKKEKKCNNNEQYSRIFAYTTIPPAEAHVHDYLAPVL